MPKDTCDYNHLLLYAKNHYQRGVLMDDLKKIVAERCGMFVEHISPDDVWQNVLMCLLKYANQREIEYFLGRLFQHGVYDDFDQLSFGYDTNCPIIRALRMALGMLSTLKVMNKDGTPIMELGEPDPKILPLNPHNAESEVSE